jgi:hypothetical protein
MTKFTLETKVNPATGDVELLVRGRITVGEARKIGSHDHLLRRLLGALDDAAEMWDRETA